MELDETSGMHLGKKLPNQQLVTLTEQLLAKPSSWWGTVCSFPEDQQALLTEVFKYYSFFSLLAVIFCRAIKTKLDCKESLICKEKYIFHES